MAKATTKTTTKTKGTVKPSTGETTVTTENGADVIVTESTTGDAVVNPTGETKVEESTNNPTGEDVVAEDPAVIIIGAEPEADANALILTKQFEEASNPRIGDTVARGKMKQAKVDRTVGQMIRAKKKIRFDLSIQRNNVWSSLQMSMLIHSLMDGFPVPQFFVEATNDDQLWMLDGKQRLSSILGYVDNMYPLAKNTPDVLVEYDDGRLEYKGVEGKFFRDLEEDIQNEILDYSLSIVEIKNITISQREELFQRLNSGSALTTIELTRAKAGVEIMDFVNEASQTRFFKDFTALSGKQRNRFVDQELIFQILSLQMGRVKGFSSKEIADFVKALREGDISEEIKQTFMETSLYLEEALEQFVVLNDKDVESYKVMSKFTKKVHIPMIFANAMDANANDVPAVAFGVWVKGFFDDRYKSGEGDYGMNTLNSVASKTKVDARLKALKADYEMYIYDAVEKMCGSDAKNEMMKKDELRKKELEEQAQAELDEVNRLSELKAQSELAEVEEKRKADEEVARIAREEKIAQAKKDMLAEAELNEIEAKKIAKADADRLAEEEAMTDIM